MTDPAVDVDGPDPVCADDRYPRYEPGIYQVLCYAVKIYPDPRFKRWVCWLQCQFLGEKDKVSGFLNMGTGSVPAANRGSEYWRVWVMAKGEQPRRGVACLRWGDGHRATDRLRRTVAQLQHAGHRRRRNPVDRRGGGG